MTALKPVSLDDKYALDRGRVYMTGIQALVRRRARSWSVGTKILWRFVKSPASY